MNINSRKVRSVIVSIGAMFSQILLYYHVYEILFILWIGMYTYVSTDVHKYLVRTFQFKKHIQIQCLI